MYKSIRKRIWKLFLSDLYHKRHLLILNRLPELIIDGRMLDIGTGNGALAVEIAKRYGLDTVGMDTDSTQKDHPVPFIKGDGCFLPFSNEKFILITAISTIEHIPEEYRSEFLREVRRVMTRDGIFVLQIPNRFFPIEPHSYLPFIGYFPPKIQSIFYSSYCDIPSITNLKKIIKANGFTATDIISYKIEDISLPKKLIKLSKIVPFMNRMPFGYIILARKTK